MIKKKRNTVTAFIALGLGAVALFFIKGAKSLQKLEILFDKIAKVKVSNWKLYIYFNVTLNNPTKNPVQFQGLDCKILFENTQISTLRKLGETATVPAFGKLNLKNLESRVDAISLITQLAKGGSAIKIQGYVQADGFQYPVNEIITIEA